MSDRPQSAAERDGHVLLTEVRAPELPRLHRREPWCRQRLDHLVSDIPLMAGKARRIGPAQPSADVVMHPRLRTRNLLCAPPQIPYLLEQRPEQLVIDGQVGRIPLTDRIVGADSDRYRPRRREPPALGSAPSALPRLETSPAPGGRSLVEGLDAPPLSGRLGLGDLNEPLTHGPLVLSEQHAAELGETVVRIVERAEDRFAVRDRQRGHLRLKVVSFLELSAVASKPASRSSRESVSTSASGTGTPASITHQSIICSYGRALGRGRPRLPSKTSLGRAGTGRPRSPPLLGARLGCRLGRIPHRREREQTHSR